MKNTKKLAFRGGTYSLILTALVLAILIVVNVCAAALPASLTKLDISSSKLYSITSNTKVVVNSLQQDVTIYWVVQADKEDSVLENLLAKYKSLSSCIDVVKKNPDIFPTFTQQYTSESVPNNSLIVESGDRYRYLSYNDIYVTESDLYSYTYTTSFDGEGAITSAIDYVVSETLPQVYTLTGHGEADLPSTFLGQLEKENVELQSLSLLTADAVPEDCACLVIYAPKTDISSEEKTMLADWAKNGGKLLVMAGPSEESELETLYSLLADYGVTKHEGIVVEADRDHYAFQYPYVLIPDMASDAITDSLIESNYSPILPIASGLTVSSSASGVTELLSTSDRSFSKVDGFAITTYEKEADKDIDGPFALAVSIDCGNEGQIVWFSASDFVQDMYNAYSSGANTNLAMNAVTALLGEREAIAIRSKSLNYNYLTISHTQGTMLKALLIGIIPLAYLGYGIAAVVDTRRKQNAEEA